MVARLRERIRPAAIIPVTPKPNRNPIMMTIPNLLTLARLVLLVPICLLLAGGFVAQFIALFFYVLAAISDYIDGWWARQYNAGSELGRILDPIVDKIFIAAIFLMLASNGTLGFWGLTCAIIILGREFLIAGLREYAIGKGQVIHVTKLAKWKTTLQMVALGLLILPVSFVQGLGFVVLFAATALTIITAVEYIRGVRFDDQN